MKRQFTMHTASSFLRKNVVMVVALVAAIVTAFFVPPDRAYLDYFDVKTLTCLFCVLAVVCALKNIQFFYILAKKIVQCFRNARLAVLALVYITFIGSMLIANDMALLTFLPLGYLVLSSTGKQKFMAFTFIMQNIAANLGGMLTPFGNPQNLYLYTKFEIPTGEFVQIMLLPFAVSVALITLCCLIFVKPEPLQVADEKVKLPVWRTVLYLALFALAIAIVFRGIPYGIGLVVIPAVLLVADRKALKMVDYPLLLTFVFFFVFSGNMARIQLVRDLFAGLLEKRKRFFRQSFSQKRGQTLPILMGSGMRSLMISNALRKSPSLPARTYSSTAAWAGHAISQGASQSPECSLKSSSKAVFRISSTASEVTSTC